MALESWKMPNMRQPQVRIYHADDMPVSVMEYDEVYYDYNRNCYTTRHQTEEIKQLEKMLEEKERDTKNLIAYYFKAR
jgi:hypothetical protein